MCGELGEIGVQQSLASQTIILRPTHLPAAPSTADLTMSNYKPGAYGRNYNYNYSSEPVQRPGVQPPPPGAQKSKHGYSTMSSIASGALATYNYTAPKRKIRTEEE